MKKILILLTVLLVLGSSCSDFLTVNEINPNSASAVPANLVLTAAINNTARIVTQPDNYTFCLSLVWLYVCELGLFPTR